MTAQFILNVEGLGLSEDEKRRAGAAQEAFRAASNWLDVMVLDSRCKAIAQTNLEQAWLWVVQGLHRSRTG